MELILKEIERAVDLEIYYLALAMALTLPDMCAALASSSGETTRDLYIEWYEENLANVLPWMTAKDCWKMRSAVLHQGKTGHPHMQHPRVLFTLPNSKGVQISNNMVDGALNFYVPTFCRDVVGVTRAWLQANKDEENVVRNMPNMVQLRPNGVEVLPFPLIS